MTSVETQPLKNFRALQSGNSKPQAREVPPARSRACFADISSAKIVRRLLLLFDNEQKVHVRCSYAKRNIWDDRHNFSNQAIEKLLEFILMLSHTEVKTMNFVFHGVVSISSHTRDT